MSLGEAFIDINANTDAFKAKLKALSADIDALQAKANSALSGISTRAGTGTSAGASPAVAAQESIAAASRAAADAQIADVQRVATEAARSQAEETADAAAGARERAQIAAREAGEVVAESDAAYRAAKENYEKTAAAAEAASARSIKAQERVLKAEEAQRAKQAAIERNSQKLASARETIAAGSGPGTDLSAFRKALAAEEQAIAASGRLGEAEAKTFGVLERARLAAEKAAEQSFEADTKAYRALVARDAEIERSNAALSNQSRLLYELTKVETAATAADEALTKAREQLVFATDAAGQADLRLAQAERSVAAAAETSARVVIEGAAQEATALRALGAVAEEAAAKIARVNAAGVAAPTTAPAAVTDTSGVESTVAAEKANIAASQSAIAAIKEERAARRAQLDEAIAAGDETVKALRAEIAEEGKLANAVISAEKAGIAASRARIAVINEETLALKARNEAAGETGPARAVSPVAALNNAAVRQQLADMAAVAKAGQKAIEDAAKNAPQFSPGSASGIAQFQQVSDAAKKAAADQVKYNEEVLASARRTAQEIVVAETEAYAIVAADARTAAATARQSAVEQSAVNDALTKAKLAQTKADAAIKSSARESARDAAAAYQAAYEKISAAAEASGGLQREQFAKTVTAAKAAAAEQIAAAQKSNDQQAASLKSIKSAASSAFGAITTGAKFATIGVLGLGAALVGIGISNAAKQQSAIVGFTALAKQIEGSQQALDNFNQSAVDAANGLTKAQSVGKDFENQLIALSNSSILSQSALQSTTQSLLALGFTGPQALSTIRDIGNALAASGKDAGQTNEDLKGIVVAFSQIKGAGRLLAQDLNQITTRIPSAGRLQVYKQLAIVLSQAGLITQKVTEKTDESSAAFAKTAIQIQKLAKEGKIAADVAIPAITKALEAVPGAAEDAFGNDALARQNLTLSGRFDALKDNIRSSLAKAFLQPITGTGGKTISDQLADQVGKFIPQITDAIAKAGPPLAKFTQQFLGFLGAALPPLVALIAKVFGSLADALDKIDLKKLTDGFGQLSTNGTAAHKAVQDFAAVAREAYDVAKLLVPIITAAVKSFALLASILAPLEPAIKGITDVLGKLLSSDIGQGLLAVAGGIAAATLALKAFKTAIIALKGIEELALLARGWKAVAGAEDLATAGAKRYAIASDAAIGGGLLAKIGKARAALALLTSAEVVVPVVAGAVIGAGIATALNAHTPKGFSDADELSVEKFNQGLKDLQTRLDGVSDAKAKQQLQDLVKTTLSSNDAQDRFKGALVAAQKVIDNYDAHHIVGQNNQLTKSLTDVHFAAVISKEAVANLIRVGTITSSTAGIDNIDAQLRQLTLDGNAAAEAIFRAERQAAGFTTNTSISAADAASIAAQDAAKGRAAAAGGPTQPGAPKPAPRAPTPVDLTDAADAAGGAATSAASTLADRIKTAKQTIADALKAFKTDVTTETPKQIRSTLNTLRREFDKLGKLEGVNTSGLDKLLAKDSAALQKFSKDLAKTTKDLANATARFDAVRSSIQDFASVGSIDLASIGLAAKDATTKLADLSKLRIIKPGQDALNVISGGSAIDLAKGAQRFADALKARLAQITEFQANVDKLIKEGLNKTTIDQIISQGPEQGGVLAQSLAGASKQTIDQINATQKGIDAAAKKLANTAVDSLFRSGQAVVSGLLQGLKDKEKDIVAAMKHIADVLVAEIQKRLKVHSPSRVMHAIGEHVAAGLHRGMTSKVSDIAAAANSMAAAAVPTIAPIDLDTLGGLARAEANLKLNAALAPSTLDIRHVMEPGPKDISLREHRDALVAAFGPGRPEPRVYTPTPPPGRGANPNPNADALARAVRGLR